MLLNKILNTIKKYKLINNGESIIVGVSGGPDSVCLLHILHGLKEQLSIKIHTVHINHMLRGNESDCDQEYVGGLCEKLGIPLHVTKCDIKMLSEAKGISLEEAGRLARYDEFKRSAEKTGSARIAVAHNKNDQAETVLMNIIRGTGLDGLKGMEYINGNIIRPLLDITRDEIERYCSENGLNPRTDSSNLSSIYTRNRVRREIVPLINERFNTDITDKIFRMSSIIKEESSFLEETATAAFKDCIDKREGYGISIKTYTIKGLHPALAKRILRLAFKDLKGNLKGIENIHVEDVFDMAINGRTGSQLHLPGNLRVYKDYEVLKIYYENGSDTESYFEAQVEIPGITSIWGNNLMIKASIIKIEEYLEVLSKYSPESFEQFFDYEKLQKGMYIRTRKNGDIFKPYNSNGTKKLKEYFIDKKISREARKSIPLIAMGNEIVWIIGYGISDKFKVNMESKTVLRLFYNENL